MLKKVIRQTPRSSSQNAPSFHFPKIYSEAQLIKTLIIPLFSSFLMIQLHLTKTDRFGLKAGCEISSSAIPQNVAPYNNLKTLPKNING